MAANCHVVNCDAYLHLPTREPATCGARSFGPRARETGNAVFRELRRRRNSNSARDNLVGHDPEILLGHRHPDRKHSSHRASGSAAAQAKGSADASAAGGRIALEGAADSVGPPGSGGHLDDRRHARDPDVAAGGVRDARI